MSIPQAIEGAKAELANLQGFQRVQRLAVYARIFAAEIFGTVVAVPFGLRAFSLHRSLPDARRQRAGSTVSILRDVRYGSQPRNIMDIYLPPNVELSSTVLQTTRQQQEQQQEQQESAGGSGGKDGAGSNGGKGSAAASGVPVVLFCHGGVWAAGSKWHYAPLATRLAQAGVITAVMQYTLYPEALVPQMVAEVSRALTWTLDNATQLGGSPQEVSLVGHSAGAQMCTMALLHRALVASKASTAAASTIPNATAPAASAQPTQSLSPASAQQEPSPPASGASSRSVAEQDGEAGAYADHRMPARLVAMAGVYDIAKHYEYEEARHVHKLSTMERAIGGSHRFPHNSPAVILAHALRRRQQLQHQHTDWELLQADPQELLREAWVDSNRPRLDRTSSAGAASEAAGAADKGPACTTVLAGPTQQQHQQPLSQQEDKQQPLQHSSAAAGTLPPPTDSVAAARYYESFELAGEAIARRIGFDRAARAEAYANTAAAPRTGSSTIASASPLGGTPSGPTRPAPTAPAAVAPASAAGDVPPLVTEGVLPPVQPGEKDDIMQFTAEAARRLPPTVLTSSCTDLIVPWYESAEMYWLLHDAGVPAKHLVYNKVSHADFVTGWAAMPRISGRHVAEESDLAPHAADLVKVVSGRVEVRFS